MPFTFQPTALSGVILIEPRVFADERGFFMECYKHSDFAAAGLPAAFVQENHSRSTRGTLRGLHFQRAPKAQGKLVRVVSGEIFDVAVDLRRSSPTFRRWIGMSLSAATRQSICIPPGFAHGFLVTSPEAEVIYKTTVEYSPEHEEGIRWDDPGLAIAWPASTPTLSERDRRWPGLGAIVDSLFP
jgi:dTDP-4-dehydrorhamnose 3,5-epimerase